MSTERLWLNFGESHEHLQSSRIGKIVNIGFKQRGYQGHRAGGHCSAGQGDPHSQSDKLTPVNIRKGKKNPNNSVEGPFQTNVGRVEPNLCTNKAQHLDRSAVCVSSTTILLTNAANSKRWMQSRNMVLAPVRRQCMLTPYSCQ